jgi:MFS transporter, AAHS family, 4-hydroxybenzoate transporter
MSEAALTRYGLWIVSVLALVMIVDGLDLQLLSLVTPVILQDWNISRAAMGPALSAALFGMALGSSIGGWLGDHYGRKLLVLGSVLLFAIATIATAMTDGVWEMTLWRVIGGLGFGAAGPNAIALASDWAPVRLRPRIASYFTIGPPLGGLIGAASAASLLAAFGWRGSFVFCGVISLLMVALVAFGVREGEHKARQSAVHAESPLREVFSPEYRNLNLGAWACGFCLSFVAYGYVSWAPVFLTTAGLSLPQALRAVLIFNLCAVAATLTVGLVITRLGSKRLLLLAIIVLAAGLSLMRYALASGLAAEQLLSVFIAAGLMGATTGAGLSTLPAVYVMAYAASCRASGLGVSGMCTRIGGILIAYLGGMLLSLRGNDTGPFFLVLLATTGIAFAALWLIDRHILVNKAQK